ncbi:MAG: serine/threonine protein kinase [Planctomycetes bacterium]|nr:serine/threonine protein kinase [Planctomycetota bacterium]
MDKPEKNSEGPLEEAYEEYLSLLEQGETPNISVFVQCFPAEIRDSLRRKIQESERIVDAILATNEMFAEGYILSNRYRLKEKLGIGGSAVVWKAHDSQLDRNVAIKVLHPFVRIGIGGEDRMIHEARALASLNHPSVTQLYDFIRTEKFVAVVMELVGQGVSLADRIRPPQEAVDIALLREQALAFLGPLRGLAEAHRRGLIHRDIKPTNVLWDGNQFKLSDFGLVCEIPLESRTPSEEIVGTLSYSSPEQLEGGSLTTATDVFSSGTTLYKFLFGESLFPGDTAYQIQKSIALSQRYFSDRFHATPRDLKAILQKATAHNPESRYRTANEFVDDLNAWCVGDPVSARSPALPERAWIWARKNSWQTVSMCALFLATLAISISMNQAKKRAEQLQVILESTQLMLHAVDPMLPAANDTSVSEQLDLLTRAIEQSQGLPGNKLAPALENLGAALISIDRFHDAATIFEKAILHGAGDSAKVRYGWCLRYFDPQKAKQVLEPIAFRAHTDSDEAEFARLFALNRLGTVLLDESTLASKQKALDIFKEIKEPLKSLGDQGLWLKPMNLMNLGTAQSKVAWLLAEKEERLSNLNDHAEALASLASAEQEFINAGIGDHSEMFYVYVAQFQIYSKLEGYSDRAIQVGEFAINIRSRSRYSNWVTTLHFSLEFANYLHDIDRHDKARLIVLSALKQFPSIVGDKFHWDLAGGLTRLADLYNLQDEMDYQIVKRSLAESNS